MSALSCGSASEFGGQMQEILGEMHGYVMQQFGLSQLSLKMHDCQVLSSIAIAVARNTEYFELNAQYFHQIYLCSHFVSKTQVNCYGLRTNVECNNSQTQFSAMRLLHVSWPRANHFKISLFEFPICANVDGKASLSHRMTGDIIS